MSTLSAPSLIGISIREFARRSGLDDKQIRRGITQGRLKLLEDGSLDPRDVGTGWRGAVRHRRNRADTSADKRQVSAVVSKVSAVSAPAAAPSTAQLPLRSSDAPHQVMGPWDETVPLAAGIGYPLEVAASAGTIDLGAFTLATILVADGVKREDVESLVERWVSVVRTQEAVALDQVGDLDPPFGCTSWTQAKPFTQHWLADSSFTWEEDVEEEAAELRAKAVTASAERA